MAAHDEQGGDPLRVGGWVIGTPGGPGGTGAAGSRPDPDLPIGDPGYDDAVADDYPRWGSPPPPPPRPRRIRRPGRLATVVRAAAPPGGYLAAAGRYVYHGRRYRHMFATPGRRTALAVVAGLGLIAVVLVANLAIRAGSPGGDRDLPSADGAITRPPIGDLPTTSAAAPPPAPESSAPPSPATATTSPRPPRTPTELSFEAEAARLFGTASVISLAGASGGRIVSSIGTRQERGNQASSGVIQFTGIPAPTTGRYALNIFYVTGERRGAVMLINGKGSQTLTFPSSGGFDVVRSLTLTIELAAGDNTITFGNPTAFTPRIDRITVYG